MKNRRVTQSFEATEAAGPFGPGETFSKKMTIEKDWILKNFREDDGFLLFDCPLGKCKALKDTVLSSSEEI